MGAQGGKWLVTTGAVGNVAGNHGARLATRVDGSVSGLGNHKNRRDHVSNKSGLGNHKNNKRRQVATPPTGAGWQQEWLATTPPRSRGMET